MKPKVGKIYMIMCKGVYNFQAPLGKNDNILYPYCVPYKGSTEEYDIIAFGDNLISPTGRYKAILASKLHQLFYK